jgi:putative transposase
MEGYNSNRNVIHLCRFHVVWCPKYRRSVLKPPVDRTLKAILKIVAQETHSKIIEMEVMPDHVHVLVECDPQFGIHRVVKRMKGRSSHELRKRYAWLRSRLPTLWTNSYFCATVGSVSLEAVKQYIENQKNV